MLHRYYAIRNPLQNHGQKKSKFAIIIVWIISISLASVQLFVARIQLVEDDSKNYTNSSSYTSFSSSSESTSHFSPNESTTAATTYTKNSTFQLQKEPLFFSPAHNAPDKSYVCNEVWDSPQKQQIYTLFNFFAVYLIPVFILGEPFVPPFPNSKANIAFKFIYLANLGYTYTCLACIVKRATQPGNANANRDLNFTKSKKKVIKMLVVLVLLFFLCW